MPDEENINDTIDLVHQLADALKRSASEDTGKIREDAAKLKKEIDDMIARDVQYRKDNSSREEIEKFRRNFLNRNTETDAKDVIKTLPGYSKATVERRKTTKENLEIDKGLENNPEKKKNIEDRIEYLDRRSSLILTAEDYNIIRDVLQGLDTGKAEKDTTEFDKKLETEEKKFRRSTVSNSTKELTDKLNAKIADRKKVGEHLRKLNEIIDKNFEGVHHSERKSISYNQRILAQTHEKLTAEINALNSQIDIYARLGELETVFDEANRAYAEAINADVEAQLTDMRQMGYEVSDKELSEVREIVTSTNPKYRELKAKADEARMAIRQFKRQQHLV